MNNSYFVYVMASKTGTLYIGVTNDLQRRVSEHKSKAIKGFSKKYACTKLVFYENFSLIEEAIEREKQLKKWRRSKKEWLIKQTNAAWKDLSHDF